MRKALTILSAAALLWACGEKPLPEPENPVPAAPTGLVLHGSTENSLTFQWDAMEHATSYAWELLQDGAKVKEGTAKGRNTSVSGLTKATDYRFGVKSVGENGSSQETWLDARTDGTVDPPQPPIEKYYEQFSIPSVEEDGVARAFPGAEGGGMYATGGRGGKVIHVTNLNDSGAGSLRAALGEKGARTVVFDVAGIIELQSRIQIKEGNLTVAGQTAPGGGICLKNYTVNVDADNVVIRFVHFRLGDEGPNAGDSEDCIWGRYHTGIVLDHCSMSWSIDECASFYANEYFTMQWCILTESMNDSAHSKGAHGYGGIWGGKDASFHHNLLANHHSRNPRIDHPEIYPKSGGTFDWSKRGNVDLRNLVVYNWGDNSSYGGEGGTFNFVNCYYKPGPDSKDRYYFVDAYSVYSSSKTDYGYPSLYLSGNIHTGHDDISSDNTVHGVYFHEASSYNLPSGYAFATSPYAVAGAGEAAYTTTHTAEQALQQVLAYGGDVLHRDSVDERAVDGVKKNTGKIINTPVEVGGWPSYSASDSEIANLKDTDGDGMPDAFEDKFGLDKASAADGSAVGLDKYGRYTNLEMYLHYLVKDIVSAQNQGGTYRKL